MADETTTPVKLSPRQLATQAELIARGIPFTPATVDWETGMAAADWLRDNGFGENFDIVAEREKELLLEQEEWEEQHKNQP